MDSLAAAPGTGPNTSPLPVLRKPRPRATFEGLPRDRAVVMGILNVTPDSFSDGGEHVTADSAIAAGLRMFYGGADIIDVGGESTRPGADEVPEDLEQERILPVVEALAKAGALVSVDTRRASTAEKALDAGATIINDVSGLAVTDEMVKLVAARDAYYVVMHNRGDSKEMDSLASYGDVVEDVIAETLQIRDRLRAAGVSDAKIILDPGLGFAKNGEQNWELVKNVGRFTALGHPVLVAASRKRFLGELLTSAGKAAPPQARDAATAAITVLAAAAGAWGVRVHDVASNLDAVKVTARAKA
ncbi:dihydropteroate synthase [Sinomonas cellulolyticus]|uniref:Dihydropteroate synthase n=1 Tax=Sinomonas cellulolyticus TaxID=2801916 RepID=A0ABS1K626_9MICC|nr:MULTISPECIES: dihydropteroate synthase [Sinomonas]MBL0706802.1 dihydropteroate synthase [Sinomonas cellulolyticus]